MKSYERDGWFAVRVSNSKGPADVVAIRAGHIRLIEVKATKSGPFSGFGPADRARLKAAARVAGGSGWLFWSPVPTKIEEFAEADWPA